MLFTFSSFPRLLQHSQKSKDISKADPLDNRRAHTEEKTGCRGAHLNVRQNTGQQDIHHSPDRLIAAAVFLAAMQVT